MKSSLNFTELTGPTTEKDAIESKDVIIDPELEASTTLPILKSEDRDSAFDGKEWVLVFPVAFFASFCLVLFFCFRQKRRAEKRKKIKSDVSHGGVSHIRRGSRSMVGEAEATDLDNFVGTQENGFRGSQNEQRGTAASSSNPLSHEQNPDTSVVVMDIPTNGMEVNPNRQMAALEPTVIASVPHVTVTAPDEHPVDRRVTRDATPRAGASPRSPTRATNNTPTRLRTNIISTTVNGTVIQLPMGSADDESSHHGGVFSYTNPGVYTSPQRLPGFMRGMLAPTRSRSGEAPPPAIITTFHGGIATVTRLAPQMPLEYSVGGAFNARESGRRLPRRRPQPISSADVTPRALNNNSSNNGVSPTVSLSENRSPASNAFNATISSYPPSLQSHADGSPLADERRLGPVQVGLPATESLFGRMETASIATGLPLNANGSLLNSWTAAGRAVSRSPVSSQAVPSCYGRGGAEYLSRTFNETLSVDEGRNSQEANSSYGCQGRDPAEEEDADYLVGVFLLGDEGFGLPPCESQRSRVHRLSTSPGRHDLLMPPASGDNNRNSTSNHRGSPPHITGEREGALAASSFDQQLGSQSDITLRGGRSPVPHDPHRPITADSDSHGTLSTANNSVCFDLNSAQPQLR